MPVDAVKRSLGMLREAGEARYAYLGVSSVELFPQLVDRFDLDVEQGRLGAGRHAGSPAGRRACAVGGGAVTFQARPTGTAATSSRRSRARPSRTRRSSPTRSPTYKPGDEVTLEVHRNGDTRQIKVKLGERPLGDVGG